MEVFGKARRFRAGESVRVSAWRVANWSGAERRVRDRCGMAGKITIFSFRSNFHEWETTSTETPLFEQRG
jgi:hypothetical protein